MQAEFAVQTRGQGLYEFTDRIRGWLSATEADGLLTLFVRHTSCSLLIQENADPEVQTDLKAFFSRLVPPSDHPSMSWLKHTYEGPDDMPSHIRMCLTDVDKNIPIIAGRLALGTWQGLFLFEHRRAHHSRRIAVTVMGE